MTAARATQARLLAAAAGSAPARATQATLLVAERATAPARATQAALLVADLGATPARATQAALLAADPSPAPARASQAALLVLAYSRPCLVAEAQCWRIARADGVVLGFTDHDEAVQLGGTLCSPCDSLRASAVELAAVLGSVGDLTLSGVISDDAIGEADLWSGVYDDAEIEVWIVPWSYVAGEVPRRIAAGKAGAVGHGAMGFTLEVLTPGARLQQQPLLDMTMPPCRWRLGSAECTVDLEALAVTGTVTAVAALDPRSGGPRRIFADDGRGEADDYFAFGEVHWLTGANAGRAGEVKGFTAATGAFELRQRMLYPVAVGDTYQAYPGCDLLDTTCHEKFDNIVNFGGFPRIPGRDALIRTPDSK